MNCGETGLFSKCSIQSLRDIESKLAKHLCRIDFVVILTQTVFYGILAHTNTHVFIS